MLEKIEETVALTTLAVRKCPVSDTLVAVISTLEPVDVVERARPVLFAYLTKYKELFVSPVTAVFPAAVEYVICCPFAKILFADVIEIKS